MIKLIFGSLGFILAIGVFVFLSDFFENRYDDARSGSIKESLYKSASIVSMIMTGITGASAVIFIAVTIVKMNA
jgi:hypothetical protein